MHVRSLGVVSERAFRFKDSGDYTFCHQPSAYWLAHSGTYGLVTWPLVVQAKGAVVVLQGVQRE